MDRAKEADARVAVAQRVEKLAGTEIDSRYENRYDAALSAYLMVLADTAQPELIAKTAAAAARAPNIRWTAGISRELITDAVATGWAQVPASPQHVIPATRNWPGSEKHGVAISVNSFVTGGWRRCSGEQIRAPSGWSA